MAHIVHLHPGRGPQPVGADATPPDTGLVWVGASVDEDWPRLAERWLGVRVHEQHQADVANPSHPPFFDAAPDFDFLALRAYDSQSPPDQPDTLPVFLVLTRRGVLSVCPQGRHLLGPLRDRLAGGLRRAPTDPADLFYLMVSMMVDVMLALREPLSAQLETWQGQILAQHNGFDAWPHLLWLRSHLRRLEVNNEGNLEALAGWVEDTHLELDERERRRFNDLMARQQRLVGLAETLQDDIDALVQVNFSMATQRNNRVLQILTVVSAVFLPLNLVVGFFGMNFTFLPLIHTEGGFFVAVGMMLALAILLASWFRLRGWTR